MAAQAFTEYAPEAATLARVFAIPEALAETVHARVAEKLRREPIEDYRIDFEDGFGVRSDVEEDAAADNAASKVTAAVDAKTLPQMFGIRVKSFHSKTTRARALRTLDRFLSKATLPENFVVTLPKITAPEQIAALVDALRPYPGVRIEIMIETPGSIFMLRNWWKQPKADASRGISEPTTTKRVLASLQHQSCITRRAILPGR